VDAIVAANQNRWYRNFLIQKITFVGFDFWATVGTFGEIEVCRLRSAVVRAIRARTSDDFRDYASARGVVRAASTEIKG
jgi:hypothetical protein